MRILYKISCLAGILLLLYPLEESYGQSDREIAERIVAVLPNSMHGWTSESFQVEDFIHVQDNGALYVEVIKNTLSWPYSDILLDQNEKTELYSTLMPLLVTANVEESRHLMKEIFDVSAQRYDSLLLLVNHQGNSGKSEILAEDLFTGLARLMSTSVRGLLHSNDDRLLSEVMIRYDTIHQSARDVILSYIKLYRNTRTDANEWLLSRGIDSSIY